MSDIQDAAAVLFVMMRREGRKSVTATYDELSVEPIQMLITQSPDGSITVSQPEASEGLTRQQLDALRREACAKGAPVTHRFERGARKLD